MRRRWAARALACLALAVSAVSAATAAPAPHPMAVYAQPQQLVRLPDGRRMNLYCLGKGPVVILNAGLGGGTGSWEDIHAQLADRFRVCAYDRAGMGFSDPGPMPRDARRRVDDLEAMLRAARLPAPYILVGHSLGGLDLQAFAFRRPREVAAMVLLDPTVAHQGARLAAAVGQPEGDGNAGRRACLRAAEAGLKPGTPQYDRCVGKPPESWPQALRESLIRMKTNPDFFRAEVSEFDSLAGADSDLLDKTRRRLGDMPLIVLTAENTYRQGMPPAYATVLSAQWMALHDEIARLSTRGSNRLVPGSGHLIQNDKPAVVIAAVREAAGMVRKR